MTKMHRQWLLATVAAILAVPTAAQAEEGNAATDVSAAAETPGGVEDIVVTAQRREQSMQDVPISMSAVTEQAIVANRIQDVSDLGSVAPNLTVTVSAGGSKLPQYSMRGIYTFGSALGTDKGISLYIDGVYIQAVAGSIFEFADVQRIEVLRGPQGTLFGRNSTGGAISVTTRDPSGEFGVRQEFTYGNYDQIRSKTRIDLPEFGPLSISASYLHSERDGDTRNLGAGTQWDHGPATGGFKGVLTSPKRLGNENVEGVFVSVKADLHPDLDLSYKFDYSENDYTPGATGVSWMLSQSTLAYGGVDTRLLAVPGFYAAQSAATRTPISMTRPDAVNNAFSTAGRTKAEGHNFTARWQATDEISFKNILAYRNSSYYVNFQLDGTGGLNLPASLGGFPFLYVANNSYGKIKQWSEELQANITNQWFNLTAGLIHFSTTQYAGGAPGEFNTLQGAPAIGQNTSRVGTPYVVPGNPGYDLSRVKMTSDAVYAQMELHVTDQIDLIGGMRITKDKKDGYEYYPGTVAAPSNGRTTTVFYRDSQATFTAGVNYKPTSDILVYAKYATGYISGGQLATIAFDPETAESWEAGIKADLFNRRLRSNLSVFDVNYGSVQSNTLGALSGVPSAAPFSIAVIPAYDTRAKGFEWENTLVPVFGLTLGAAVGYTDYKIKDGTEFPGLVFTAGAPGVQEASRPKWTVNLSGQYEIHDVAGGVLSFRADASYKSATLWGGDVSPGTGPTAQEDPSLRAATTVPASWLVNGRISLSELDIAGSQVEIALWGKNIFDNKEITNATNLGSVVAVIYERARTYGVDLTMKF